jgi:central glycolytic genes regulator
MSLRSIDGGGREQDSMQKESGESMRRFIDIQKQLLPDLVEVMKKRYRILHSILLMQPIGRRTLATTSGTTERLIRAETDFLKDQGLIDIANVGMSLTESGRLLLEQLEPLIKELFGLTDLEEQLRKKLGILQVMIIPGDSDTSPIVKKELGRAGALALKKYAQPKDVIAVTGGSTMAEVADNLTGSPSLKSAQFVPARGGLGESMELQANAIASSMAKKTGSHYRLLHVPDQLSEEAYQSLLQETDIEELIHLIRSARIVVYGIGEAMNMAKRRNVDVEITEFIASQGGVAEAFGYYFDREGTIIHKMRTVGLRLEDIHQTELVIAVAGGYSKAEAITAIMRYGHNDVLVTDEAAAKRILSLW